MSTLKDISSWCFVEVFTALSNAVVGLTEVQGGDGETGLNPWAVPRAGHPHVQPEWEHEAQISSLGLTQQGEIGTSSF